MPSKPSELIDAFLDGTRPVVAIVGAGVSFAATGDKTALWTGLLRDGIEFSASRPNSTPELADRHRQLIAAAVAGGDVDRLLDVADVIVDQLDGPAGDEFRRWLARSVGRLKTSASGAALIEVLRELSQRGVIFATTNYDSILSGGLDLRPVLWTDYRSELPILNQIKQGIIHLHGHWESPRSVIFSRSSYDGITSDDTFQSLFRHLWLGYHWLYIGCGRGSEDPNFGRLLKWGSSMFGAAGLSHFRLCLESEVAVLEEELKEQPNVRVTPYGLEHAALSHYLLELSEALPCRPFQRVRDQSQFFRTKSQRPDDVILPSQAEYLGGGVHRPSYMNELDSTLTAGGFAWLRGPASHGKTTAALLAATSNMRRGYPSYYLDLNDDAASPPGTTIENVLQSLCRPGALFVIDNVNRNEPLARRLFDSWSRRRRGSQLIFVGREELDVNSASRANRLADLQQHVVSATLTLDDLAGLFETILSRLTPGRPPPTPPPVVLREWRATFSNNLIAYCWAITAKYRRLRLGNWDLPASAASQFVWAKYLEPLSTTERDDVLLLAAFSAHELGLPPEVFGGSPFRESLKNGVVVRHHNDGDNDRYHLAEPGLGVLLLGATTFATMQHAMAVCSRSPSVAAAYAARLEATGDRAPAAEIAALLMGNEGARWLLAEHLPWAVETARRLVRLHAADFADIDRWWAGDPEILRRAFLSQPVGILGHLVRFAAENMPVVLGEIRKLLADEATQDLLSARAAGVPPYDLIQFLEAVRAIGAKGPLRSLWSKIAVLENSPRIISQALQGSLSQLDYFLTRAALHGQAAFVSVLWAELGKPDAVEKIVRNGLHDSLSHFASLTANAAAAGHADVETALWTQMTQRQHWRPILLHIVTDAPAHSVTFLKALKVAGADDLLSWLWRAMRFRAPQILLLRNALRGSLHTLTHFIQYADVEGEHAIVEAMWRALDVPELTAALEQRAASGLLSEIGRFLESASALGGEVQARRLVVALTQGQSRDAFLDQLAQASADQLVGLFQRLDPGEVGGIVSSIDAKQWLGVRERRHALPLFGLASLLECFETQGRLDLCIAETTAVVRLASIENWDQPNAGLEQLGLVLRHAELATAEEIGRFLTRSTPGSWVDSHMESAPHDSLAFFLSVVAAVDANRVLDVWRPKVRKLVDDALRDLPSRGVARGIKALALLGAANMLGRFEPNTISGDVLEGAQAALHVVEELNSGRRLGALKLQVAHGVRVLWEDASLREFLSAADANFSAFWSRTVPSELTSTYVANVCDQMISRLENRGACA